MASEGAAGGPAWTVLVTGGTGGMGRVIASRLAADGFDAAVAYVSNSDLADTAVKEIKSHGRRGAAFAADVADEEAVSALFDAVEDHFKYLDVVVHTAEINRSAALTDLDLAAPPLGRLGSPDDIADVVSFLVGPTGRWINGQVVYANGGLI